MIPYLIDTAGTTIVCGQCRQESQDPDDVYLRHCPRCGFLGPLIRARWNGYRSILLTMCEDFGRYKKVGCASVCDGFRRVPTELILTEGIKGLDLNKFPEWTE